MSKYFFPVYKSPAPDTIPKMGLIFSGNMSLLMAQSKTDPKLNINEVKTVKQILLCVSSDSICFLL